MSRVFTLPRGSGMSSLLEQSWPISGLIKRCQVSSPAGRPCGAAELGFRPLCHQSPLRSFPCTHSLEYLGHSSKLTKAFHKN